MLYEKILFYIFYLFFHIESPFIRLYHPLQDTLYFDSSKKPRRIAKEVDDIIRSW